MKRKYVHNQNSTNDLFGYQPCIQYNYLQCRCIHKINKHFIQAFINLETNFHYHNDNASSCKICTIIYNTIRVCFVMVTYNNTKPNLTPRIGATTTQQFSIQMTNFTADWAARISCTLWKSHRISHLIFITKLWLRTLQTLSPINHNFLVDWINANPYNWEERERDINTPRKAVAFHFVSLRCKCGNNWEERN